MSNEDAEKVDMIRFTFTANPVHRDEIEAHLSDLGLDVYGRADGHIVAIWEEPEGNLDEAIETLWEMNGEPFEVIHEEFHRLNLLVYHHEADGHGTDRAVA